MDYHKTQEDLSLSSEGKPITKKYIKIYFFYTNQQQTIQKYTEERYHSSCLQTNQNTQVSM